MSFTKPAYNTFVLDAIFDISAAPRHSILANLKIIMNIDSVHSLMGIHVLNGILCVAFNSAKSRSVMPLGICAGDFFKPHACILFEKLHRAHKISTLSSPSIQRPLQILRSIRIHKRQISERSIVRDIRNPQPRVIVIHPDKEIFSPKAVLPLPRRRIF